MITRRSNKRIFVPQIRELYEYVNALDEKIARYRKQGWNPALLQQKRAAALQQINRLKQATLATQSKKIAPYKANMKAE